MLSRSKSAGRSSDGTSIESGVRCIRHLSCVLCVEQLHHTRKVTVCHWWGTNPHQPDFATALRKVRDALREPWVFDDNEVLYRAARFVVPGVPVGGRAERSLG